MEVRESAFMLVTKVNINSVNICQGGPRRVNHAAVAVDDRWVLLDQSERKPEFFLFPEYFPSVGTVLVTIIKMRNP